MYSNFLKWEKRRANSILMNSI